MTMWDCTCGKSNFAEQPDCFACGNRRPLDSALADDCLRRGHTYNSALTYCERCGYRPDEDPQRWATARPATAATGQMAGDVFSKLERMNEQLLGDIQQIASSLGAIDASPRARPQLSRPPAVTGRAPALRSIERATTRSLDVDVTALPKLNYALLHAGLPLIDRIELVNADSQPAHDLLVKAWVAPDYGEAWQATVPTIAPKGRHVLNAIAVPLKKARLQEVREAEKATLRVDVFSEGTLVQSRTMPMEVLAYAEWYFHPAIPHTAACFVQPNAPAVDAIVSQVRDRLSMQGIDPSLSGYQQGGAPRVLQFAAALHQTLQADAGISYINPPPSFEQPEMLEDGGFSMSQKVFFPEQIREHRRGTCLDLAFLGAACLERMGLHPLFFLIKGHAFFGVWLEQAMLRQPFTNDPKIVRELLSARKWLPINSTTFTSVPAQPFERAVAEGAKCLEDEGALLAVVDVAAARAAGIKPVPPIVAGL